MKRSRALAFAAIFWTAFLSFIAIDWSRSSPHNRFEEPLPWQLGHEKTGDTGHCAAPLK